MNMAALHPRWKISYTKLLLFNHMGAIVTAGLMLLLAPSSQYAATASSLKWNFEILPRQLWGVLFILSSVMLFIKPRAVTGAIFSSIVLLWGVCLLAGVISGDSQSMSAWIWPTLAGMNMMLWTGFARFQP